MDTSETYIDMCEKATEIQGEWDSQVGDWYTPKRDLFEDNSGSEWKIEGENLVFKKGDIYCAGSDGFQGFESTGWCDWSGSIGDFSLLIWLPRQDQLQEMVVENYVSHRKMFVCFGFYCAEYGDINYSGEKLWLMFVMYKKHNKEWVNGDWISIDSHT